MLVATATTTTAVAAATAAATTAAATAAATVAAAATRATAAAATVAAATTAGAVFFRLGFVDSQGATAVLLAVEGRDCRLGFFIAAHLDEPETLAATGVPVRDDLGAGHGAVGAKQ